jgi:hypothetical protein
LAPPSFFGKKLIQTKKKLPVKAKAKPAKKVLAKARNESVGATLVVTQAEFERICKDGIFSAP